ncbi:MAG TPA: sigma-70 family RNA polymerase sigma factor [Acidobacteriota bacterium]
MDSDWLRSALDRYERPLVRYAAGITGNIESAREVVQDTFLRLCRQNPSRIGEHLAAWLFTVCRNRAYDVLRKESRLTPLDEADACSRESEAPPPLTVLEQKEGLTQVLSILKTLPHNQQEVLRLKFQNDLSYKEISQVTKLSVTNVGFLIHTALKTIRRQVKADLASSQKILRRVK